MDNLVIHKAEEFTNIPWHTIRPEGCTRDWSLSRGGYGLGDSWHITIYAEFGVDHVWEMIPHVSVMLDTIKEVYGKKGRESVQSQIISALGL